METKECKGKCGQIKSIIEFSLRSDNGLPNSKCRQCIKEYYEIYRKEKSAKLKQKQQEHYAKNKISILKDKKLYYEENKNRILVNAQNYYEENKEYLKAKHRAYYIENRKEILQSKKVYAGKNRKKLSNYTIQYFKRRRANDFAFALRCDLSTMIGKALKSNDGSKCGESITKYLPYTISELKTHIENQFESWMTWDNRGKYCETSWKDDDQSTWTWQIDHIVPQSTFYYISMEDEGFKKCWCLSNLRPLSAKQNHADGVNRARHK